MRAAMCASRQLPGRGGPLTWMMLLHLHVNQNSDYVIQFKLVYALFTGLIPV